MRHGVKKKCQMSQNTSWERDQDAKLSCLTPEFSIFKLSILLPVTLAHLFSLGFPLFWEPARLAFKFPWFPDRSEFM